MTARTEEYADVPNVADLVQRAGERDKWAWERLVEQYSRLIWAITRDFKLIESDAADVTQVTWLRLLEHIHKIESPERVGSWLATTARNECLRCLAARKKVVLVRMTSFWRQPPRPLPRSTSACSRPSARRWSAKLWPTCPGGGSGCSN